MDNHRMIKHSNHKSVIFFLGLLTCGCLAMAQPISLCKDSISNKRALVLHANAGFSPSASQKGESIWNEADNKSSSGFSYSCRIMSYSQKSIIGYGIYFFDYTHSKNHHFPDNALPSKEKTRVVYVAPQLSFIKRETAFPHCFGLFDLGIGYLQYTSDTQLKQNNTYKADFSGIGINLNIGYEYAFARHWGARLEVSALYSPMKPSKDASPNDVLHPRTKINLFMPSMHLGISYYL